MIEKEIQLENPSHKAPLIGVLMILVAVAGYVFFTKPLADNVDILKTDLTTKSTLLTDLKTRLDSLIQAEKELELTTEVQRIESLKAVPAGMNQDEVITDLIQIAKENNIELHSISFSKGSTNQEDVGSLRVSASFEGNYLDLTDFLEGLEENARIFKVDSISVQVSKVQITDIERASFSLTIDTFFQN